MKTIAVRAACATALVAVGWVAGWAQGQRATPDFVLTIDAPEGMTNVVCTRGCELVAARSSDSAEPTVRFTYGCGVGANPATAPTAGLRCSGTANGWVKK
jgi:hypothetical protein